MLKDSRIFDNCLLLSFSFSFPKKLILVSKPNKPNYAEMHSRFLVVKREVYVLFRIEEVEFSVERQERGRGDNRQSRASGRSADHNSNGWMV